MNLQLLYNEIFLLGTNHRKINYVKFYNTHVK